MIRLRRRRRLVVLAVVLSLIAVVPWRSAQAAPGGGSTPDPYTVLGVSPTASQEAIRQRYRKLCLQLHPDKNTNKKPAEQKRSEERFKQVQAAYDLVGSSDARKTYDTRSAWGAWGGGATSTASRNGPYGSSSAQDAFTQAFRSYFERAEKGGHPYFRFYFSPGNGFASRPMFRRQPSSASAFWPNHGTTLNSIYLQKVRVPLKDLYTGKSGMEFRIRDTIWARYRAAFRGGIAWILFYQSILYTLPLFRVITAHRWILSGVTLALFHRQLPKLSDDTDDDSMTSTFLANIRAGYKGGTKFTFSTSDPGNTQVVFILAEEPHPIYHRVGNDLHATVTLDRKQAVEGCDIQLEPLDDNDTKSRKIDIAVPPGQRTGDTLTLRGHGWPIRKTGRHGNLVVHFRIVSQKRKQRRRRRRSCGQNKKRK